MLVATDFSAASRHALTLAHDVAGLIGATVHAVHVVFDERVRSHEHYEVHEHLRGLIDAATVDLAAMLADYPDVPASVRAGIPHQEIIQAADAANADVIAIGLHGHNPIEAAFLGSTANRVVRRAPCVVLVTR